MFFGAVVKTGSPVTLDGTKGELLHLSHAVLATCNKNDRALLMVKQGTSEYCACVLQKGVSENCSLDLFLPTQDGITLSISGSTNEVHLTGFYEPEDEAQSESDDEESMANMMEGLKGTNNPKIRKAIESAAAAASGIEESDVELESDSDDENEADEEEGDEVEEDADEDDEEGGDDAEEEDDEEDEEEEEEVAPPPTKGKQQNKKQNQQAAKPAVVDKKRKVEEKAPISPVKQARAGNDSPSTTASPAEEAKFEKDLITALKANGKMQASQLAGKVKKPDSLKNTKYLQFIKAKPKVFSVKDNTVSLVAA